MSASATTHPASRHVPIRRVSILAVIVAVSLIVGLLAGYTWGQNTTSGTTADVAPLPFRDGYIPAQPM